MIESSPSDVATGLVPTSGPSSQPPLDSVARAATEAAATPSARQAPIAPDGPVMPKRTRWLDMPDEYGQAGMKVKVWINYPAFLGRQITDDDQEVAKAAMCQIVLEHNNWNKPVEEGGGHYAPASDPLFWDELSNELAITIITLLNLTMTELPNSLVPTRRR